MRKGIKDPWRVVEPLKPEPPKPRDPDKKRNLGDADFDADLRATPYFDLRGNKGSLRVQAESGFAALERIVRFLDSLGEIDEAIGYKSDKQGVDFNRENFVSGTAWKTVQDGNEVLVCFRDCDNDHALLLLVNTLIAEHRKDRTVYTKFGIQPIQR